MGDRVGQFRPVQRVEMEFIDAVGLQGTDLFGGDDGGDHAAGFHFVLDAFEELAEPVGDADAGDGGELDDLGVVGDRHDARDDGGGDAGSQSEVEEAQDGGVVEEVVGDGAGGAGVELALEVVQVGERAGGGGVDLLIPLIDSCPAGLLCPILPKITFVSPYR